MEKQRESNHRVVMSQGLQVALPSLALGLGPVAIAFAVIFAKWATAFESVIGFHRLVITSALFRLPFFRHARKRRPHSRLHIAIAAHTGTLFAFDTTVFYTSIQMRFVGNATLFENASQL